MNDSQAIIQSTRLVNQHYQYVELNVTDDALRKIKPGQSLLVRRADPSVDIDPWNPYLREQWWPLGLNASQALLIERPMSFHYNQQEVLQVLGPIGEPFRFRKALRAVLLIAYDTAPIPLVAMISQLVQNQVEVTLVLIGSARDYRSDHLPPEVEVIHGEDTLKWSDQVMTLGWADQIFVVVNPDDELARFSQIYKMIEEKRNDVPKSYVFGVFQPILPCGVGACSACLLRVGGELVPACSKGPAFDLTQVALPK